VLDFGRLDHRLQFLDRRQHGLVALRHESKQQPQLRVRIGLPLLQHGPLHVRVEPCDLRDVFRNDRDEHLAPIALVAFAAYKACLLQPIHHAGDGAGGQARDLGQPSRGHTALQIEEIEAFEIGTRDTGAIGNRLRENRAHPGRPPYRVFQFLHQRRARFCP